MNGRRAFHALKIAAEQVKGEPRAKFGSKIFTEEKARSVIMQTIRWRLPPAFSTLSHLYL